MFSRSTQKEPSEGFTRMPFATQPLGSGVKPSATCCCVPSRAIRSSAAFDPETKYKDPSAEFSPALSHWAAVLQLPPKAGYRPHSCPLPVTPT